MPRVNNVIQQVSQLNTYEQEKVFDFLKTVLMSNGITNSIDEEIAENTFNKGKCCPFCSHDKISKYGVNDNITMNRKWKIKMYKNDH